MSKYDALWRYIGDSGKRELTLSFDDIANICKVAVDHSFLKYKSELTAYGYTVVKISMKRRQIEFQKIQNE